MRKKLLNIKDRMEDQIGIVDDLRQTIYLDRPESILAEVSHIFYCQEPNLDKFYSRSRCSLK